MPETLDLRNAPAGSPEWWLARLLVRLEARRADLETFEAYYDGHQPLAFASQKFRDAFGTRFREFSSNFMSLVVDAPGERLEVQGFRFGDAEGDEDIWRRVWQENDLDAGSQLAHTEALMKGVAYAIVEPQGDGVPVVTIEDALDCVVETAPKDRRERVAALKRWVDDEGHQVAYLHLPDAVYKYRSLGKAAPVLVGDLPTGELPLETSSVRWTRLEVPDEPWPLPNPLGVVPVVAEHDAGLVAGGRGDVHLGLGLAVGDEEVEAGRGGLHGLAVLPRQAQADLGVDAKAGGGIDLEGLPPELLLPVLEDEGLAGPPSLRMEDVVLAEGREAGTAGVRIGDHGLFIAAAHHAQTRGRPEDVLDVAADRGRLDPQPCPRGRAQAELASEEADRVGVVAHDLVQRILHELAVTAHQRARLRIQLGRLRIAADPSQ